MFTEQGLQDAFAAAPATGPHMDLAAYLYFAAETPTFALFD
jgi:hypothetical protein